MTTKEEALALADELKHGVWYKNPYTEDKMDEASAMIRRLVEELDKQNPSMFTILSCGCRSAFMGFPSEWDGETRECEPCVNYGSLCEQHFMEYEARPAQYLSQTKPLNDEEIKQIYEKIYEEGHDNQVLALARAIEERHGIK